MAHYRKKGNKWYYRITYTDEYGTHHIERAGGLIKTKCLQAWREAMVEIQHKGTLKNVTTMTFSFALDGWLSKEVAINSKQATYEAYQSTI